MGRYSFRVLGRYYQASRVEWFYGGILFDLMREMETSGFDERAHILLAID